MIVEPPTARCATCKKRLHLSAFKTRADAKIGRYLSCKACRATIAIRTRYKTNAIVMDHGRWIEVDVSTGTYPGMTMKIDKADWSKVQGGRYGRWSAAKSACGFYANAFVSEIGRTVRIHRAIFGNRGEHIDHINHNGLDNRRRNLRPCTCSQNLMNSKTQDRNSSGVRGVSYCKLKKKFKATIIAGGRAYSLGYHARLDDAGAARRKAEEVYYKGFMYNPLCDTRIAAK